MNDLSLIRADLGTRPTLAWLDLDDLYIEKAYQRSVTSKRSQTIIAADEIADQATSFTAINKNRVVMTAPAIHPAEVAAGDVHALRVKRVCDAAGIRIANHTCTTAHKANETVAVGVIRTLSARQYGEHRMELTLRALARSAGGGGSMLKAALIRAAFAIQELNPRPAHLDQERLIEVLLQRTADEWIRAARAYKDAVRVPAVMAMITLIAREYNKGLQKNKMRTGGVSDV